MTHKTKEREKGWSKNEKGNSCNMIQFTQESERAFLGRNIRVTRESESEWRGKKGKEGKQGTSQAARIERVR